MSPTSQRLKEYRKQKIRKELYFTRSEMNDFQKVADQEGIGVGIVIKNMALAYLQQRPTLSKEQESVLESIESQLSGLTLLIRNVANNVNQITRHSQRVESLVNEYELLDNLKDLDTQMRAAIEEAMNRLGKG